jgi:hypothetical protein
MLDSTLWKWVVRKMVFGGRGGNQNGSHFGQHFLSDFEFVIRLPLHPSELSFPMLTSTILCRRRSPNLVIFNLLNQDDILEIQESRFRGQILAESGRQWLTEAIHE